MFGYAAPMKSGKHEAREDWRIQGRSISLSPDFAYCALMRQQLFKECVQGYRHALSRARVVGDLSSLDRGIND